MCTALSNFDKEKCNSILIFKFHFCDQSGISS